MIEEKPLTPINHGQILIVGGKTSNFDSDILDNPRVLLWDSQNENWHSKEIPSNTVAIFMTRFIGHNTFLLSDPFSNIIESIFDCIF